ncbi:hypothetical protein BC629DRAFT_1451318 [Irpex lacteus]|nr:hypothetical protein BC629DRAFT_1451318 [Irpex lacteus]
MPPKMHIPADLLHDYSAQLPDEIAETIIRETGRPDGHGTPMVGTGPNEKRNWISCGSVCRRWYRIALPHIMHYIRVTDSENMEHYTGNTPTASKFLSFLQQSPSLARLIQEVCFSKVALSLHVLSSTVSALPNLRRLILHRSIVERDLDSAQAVVARKIDNVIFTGGACYKTTGCPPALCRSQVTQLLSLFSVIEEFEVIGSCSHEKEISVVGESNGNTPQIRSLKTKLDLSYYHVLHRLHLLDHLTCLHLTITGYYLGHRELIHVDEFLYVAGVALQELYLSYIQSPYLGSDRSKSVAHSIRRGLAACRSLHGFRLTVKIYLETSFWASRANMLNVLHQGFLIGIENISLLDTHKIKHLSFQYGASQYAKVNYLTRHCRPEDIHALDWTRFRQVCRRFVHLRSFMLQAFAEEEEFRQEFSLIARDELQDLKDVMLYGEPGTFFRCDDDSCAWYTGGRLNRMKSLLHDY